MHDTVLLDRQEMKKLSDTLYGFLDNATGATDTVELTADQVRRLTDELYRVEKDRDYWKGLADQSNSAMIDE